MFTRGGHLYMVVAAVVVGLLGALGAVLFRLMIRTVTAVAFSGSSGLDQLMDEGLFAEPHDPIAVARELAWYWKIAIPAAGGFIVGPLIWFFAREARGHGVPEVIKAVAVRGGIIRARVVAIKSLASAISIGTGGSVGREGPIVQIGSAVGSQLGQFLRLPTIQVRTLVGCGAAAGISATFNAPIAGALFTAEVIIGGFAVASFSPIVISSVVATVVSRFFLGNHPAFPVPEYVIVSPFELIPYMAVGVITGLVAVVFIRSINIAEDFFELIPIPVYLKAGLGGAMVGVIALYRPEVFGVGYTTITGALTGELTAMVLGTLLVAKIAATSLTIGSGGSGGVFAPSLFLGAMTGGFVGSFIHQWFPDATATSGAYALVAMGAVVAATTHAPVSAIIILFELTQTIDIIPALMTACVLSSLVCQMLSHESIYTSKLIRQGIDIFKKEDPNALKGFYVRDVIDRDPEVLAASANFQAILDLVVSSRHTQFFVVDGEGKFLGAIALSEVRRLIYEQEALQHLVVAGELADDRQPTLTEEDDLDVALHVFSASEHEELAVLDSDDPSKLVGTLREKDVIETRNREMLRRDLAGGLSSSVSVVGHGQLVDLGGGYALQEMIAPHYSLGKSLSQLNLRARTGAHVLLLRRHGATGDDAARVPTADDVIEEGDTLVVAGSGEALEKLHDWAGD
jgi:CIC family chloride channel protein